MTGSTRDPGELTSTAARALMPNMVMGTDAAAERGDDEQAGGVQDASVRVIAVEGEGDRLAVGADLDQPVAVASS